MTSFNSFLSPRGLQVYKAIEEHCKAKGIAEDVDQFELTMLANSFDLYFTAAADCKKNGTATKPKKGGWEQISPSYVVMKSEYQNIIKHGAKFGLSPGDRNRIFKGVFANKLHKKKTFDLTLRNKVIPINGTN